jgi:tRNA 2-thiocytidine biosynthesis protein TtcA
MGSRIEKKLMSNVGRASQDFRLVEPGDKIMVCLSGGKDSYAMAHLLEETRKRVPFDFELVMVNLDQGQPGFTQQTIVDWCERNGYAHHMVYRDTYSVVTEKIPAHKTFCSLCSRLRRGILYDTAVELGCTKIALGHHKDDVIETLMLNLFFSGQLKSMPPRLTSDDKRNVVIRPLIYCTEAMIQAFSDEMEFPILPCNLCGSQENLQRAQMKKLLNDLNSRNPNIKSNIFASLTNIRPSHVFDPKIRQAFGYDLQDPVGVDDFLGPSPLAEPSATAK